MPNNRTEVKAAKEKSRLAQQIADQYIYLSYSERLAVCIALDIHEETMERYRKGKVAKIPTALKMLAEMKKVVAERENQPA